MLVRKHIEQLTNKKMNKEQNEVLDDIEMELEKIADDAMQENIKELNEQGIKKRKLTMNVWQWIAQVLLKNLSIRFYWKEKEIFRIPPKEIKQTI